MNSVRRAYFYLREKRKQTALLFFFFLLFMGLILGCLYYESRVELEKKKLAHEEGICVIVVTHMRMLAEKADDVIRLENKSFFTS